MIYQANQTRKNKPLISLPILITLLAILAIGFAFGCAFDKQISEKLYLSHKALNQIIGGIISNIGIELGYFAIFTAGFSFIISSYAYKNNQKWKTIIVNIVLPITILFLIYFRITSLGEWTVITGSKSYALAVKIPLIICCAAASFLLSWFYIRKLDKIKVFKTMFWLLVFIIIITIFREFLCRAWSRPRPKAVFDETTPIEYKPVWLPDLFRSYDKSAPLYKMRVSFPSGHTATSGFVVGLVSALYKAKGFKSQRNSKVFLIVAILIMLLTAFGRMLAGWHFLTDVTFGALLSIAGFITMNAVFNDRV